MQARMKKLSVENRAAILRCLIEGNSILATSRMTGAAKNTIIKFLAEAGEACAAYQDASFRNLTCKVLYNSTRFGALLDAERKQK